MYVIGDVVFDAEDLLVDGVESIGQLLHEDRVFSDIPQNWVSPLLEDVDNIRGLNLGLGLSFFLLGTTHQVHLPG